MERFVYEAPLGGDIIATMEGYTLDADTGRFERRGTLGLSMEIADDVLEAAAKHFGSDQADAVELPAFRLIIEPLTEA